MKSGFTLLELLIVIAIIGLLASVILVSYNGYIEKAKLANTLQWASGLSHSLFYEAVGVWSFNEGSGQTAQDESGKGNNGTLGSTGGSDVNDPVWRCANASFAYVPSGEGCSLQFYGTNDYVDVVDNTSLKPSSAITIAGWVKMNSLPASGVSAGVATKIQSSNAGYGLWTYNNAGVMSLLFNIYTTAYTERATAYNFQTNQWYYLTATYDGINMISYVNRDNYTYY